MLAAWVLFPAVALVLTLGCGLLLEVATGRHLPGALLAPAGFGVVIAAASLTTMWPRTATATAPVAISLAVAGYGLGLRRRRVELPAVAAALGVFAVYAAPIVLSGSATFAGYVTLDDTSTWLALTDNVMSHGRAIGGLQPSTYSTVLADYFHSGYPLGAFLPLGIGHVLTRQDSAWIFQPEIAFAASMLALALYSLSGPLLASRRLRAVTAFLGAQAALLYGYSFWSGIKEITAAALVALVAALVAALLDSKLRYRELLCVAVACAAVIDTDAIVGVVWLAGLALLFVVLAFTVDIRRVLAGSAWLLVATGVLAVPAIVQARAFITHDSAITSSGPAGLGNLLHPLSLFQVLGIWPAGDFRTRPGEMAPTYALLAVAALACVVAIGLALRRRLAGLPLYVALAGGGALAVVILGKVGEGSPWLDGKSLAMASPALVATAAAGAAALIEARRSWRVAGVVGAVAIGGGVLWSNGLAYAEVWLAPRAQLSELQTIGHEYAGDGPTLMTEYQPYGVRHFLRSLDPEGASERRAREDQLSTGGVLAKGQYADIDAFDPSAILVYRTLVLRASPVASRPPSVYQSVWSGPYYEVWQRTAAPPTILEHLSLGTATEPDSPAPCADVERLAALASANHGSLIASERPQAIVVDLATVPHPPRWTVTSGGLLVPSGGGTVTAPIDVTAPGPYQVSLGGSFRGTVKISIDGTSVGSQTSQYSETDQLVPFRSLLLDKGTHTVTIAYSRDRLRPGEGSYSFGFGPLDLGEPATQAQLEVVSPADATSLCGKTLDWVEAVTEH